MKRYTIVTVGEQLDAFLNNYGFSIIKDLKPLGISPEMLTDMIGNNYEEIIQNNKSIIYNKDKLYLLKHRFKFNNQGKSNGLRVYLVINRSRDYTITPIRIYSAKHKPKNENNEESRLKDFIDKISDS